MELEIRDQKHLMNFEGSNPTRPSIRNITLAVENRGYKVKKIINVAYDHRFMWYRFYGTSTKGRVMDLIKILEQAEINQHGQAVLSADEYADVVIQVKDLVEALRDLLPMQGCRDCQDGFDICDTHGSIAYTIEKAEKALSGVV